MTASSFPSVRHFAGQVWPLGNYRWRSTGVGCLFLFFSSFMVIADDSVAVRDQIQELIRTLDASTLSERTRAERQLLDLGPQVLPKLPVLETIESVSTRESLKRIRVQLERRAAKESSGPSRISLQGEFNLEEILAQIEKQTSNRISLHDDPGLRKQRLSVAWEGATFWECLDEICDQGQLQWRFPVESAGMEISQRTSATAKSRAIQRSGPFRIAIENVEIRPVVGESRQKLIRVHGRLSMEPRLRPLFLAIAAANLKATTSDDQLLPPWNPGAKYEHPVRDGGHEVQIYWDFSSTDTVLPNFLTIGGRIHCQFAAATERITFDQTSLTEGTIRRRGGVSVRLREVAFTLTKNEKLDASIGVGVSYETGGPAFESHRTWIFHNAVYLETKNGTRISYTDFDTAQQSDGAVAVDYRWQQFDAPSAQYNFVYEAPTLIIDVPLDIKLDRIPTQ